MNASGDAMTRMRAAMDGAAMGSTWAEYEAQDDSFHRRIAEASDNALLLALFDQLNQVRRVVAWGSVKRETSCPAADHSSFAEHKAIVEAISNGTLRPLTRRCALTFDRFRPAYSRASTDREPRARRVEA